jgi:phage gp29-like protein
MAKGIWVSKDQFVRFAEDSPRSLTDMIATRDRSIDFTAIGIYLPNPDPVLKKLGLDIKTYKDLCVDAHIGGCVKRRKAAITAMDWEVSREQSSSKVTKAITAMLSDLDMHKVQTQMMEAALYGYQALEIAWQSTGSLLIPVDIEAKPPEWFRFNKYNELRFLTRWNMLEGEALPDKKFLIPRNEPTYQNPYGQAALAMCFWPAAFKKGGLKFWVTFCEKFGMPWVIGKHPRSASNDEKNLLLDQLADMVQDAVAVIPDDSSVEIQAASGGASGNGEQYERLLMYCRSEIAIALLGQNQSTEASANKASATAAQDVTREIRDGDARMIEAAFNTLINWICELNFGGAAPPKYKIKPEEDIDKTLAERDLILTQSGVKFKSTYFKRVYNLQDDDIEEIITPTDSTATPPEDTTDFAEHQDSDYADATADVLAQEAQPALDQWLARIRKIVAKAPDLPALQKALLDDFAELDEADLTKAMALAFSCAELSGRYDVSQND